MPFIRHFGTGFTYVEFPGKVSIVGENVEKGAYTMFRKIKSPAGSGTTVRSDPDGGMFVSLAQAG